MSGGGTTLLEGMPAPWDLDDTERYLTDFPLPNDFTWRGRAVVPRYRISKGYGFWLRTTPYHPGLFEAVHRFIARCEHLPAPVEMAVAMRELEASWAGRQGEMELQG